MIDSRQFRLMDSLRDETAQVLPWMVLLVALFLGCAGLCIDLGHAYIVQRQLQASTDAAALAGGYALSVAGATTTTVDTAAKAYSSLSTGSNASPSLPSVTFSDTFKCVTSIGLPCTATTGDYNAIQVTQTSTITTMFIQLLNIFKAKPMTSMKISTTATAAMRGSISSQYNIALVVDTTKSMGDPDSDGNCSGSRLACAQAGIQTLLEALTPCTASTAGQSNCTAFDSVAIFTFPNIQAGTATDDTTCTNSTPTTVNYSTPAPGATWSAPTGTTPTYEVTTGATGATANGFMSNYSSTGLAGGALNSSSGLAIAAGAGVATKTTACSGLQVTSSGKGTYLPGAIYAAQSALVAEQALHPGSLNALIVLSDGDADSTQITASNGETLNSPAGTYPSTTDECQQAVTAAKYASNAGTTVYTVAYGAETTGAPSYCKTDTTGSLKGLSPCTELQDMATTSADFYSDATTANKGACTSSLNPNLTLAEVFKSISGNFTVARLIPNGAS